MKLFFKRPPEMQSMLGRLLSFEVNEEKVTDVHDRALFYFRLLAKGVDEVGPKPKTALHPFILFHSLSPVFPQSQNLGQEDP